MAALISWVCSFDHSVQEPSDHLPVLTLHGGQWAYCLQGGDSDHTWRAIEPAPIEMLRGRRYRPQGSQKSEEARTK